MSYRLMVQTAGCLGVSAALKCIFGLHKIYVKESSLCDPLLLLLLIELLSAAEI